MNFHVLTCFCFVKTKKTEKFKFELLSTTQLPDTTQALIRFEEVSALL
jgi:hypothetical protein